MDFKKWRNKLNFQKKISEKGDNLEEISIFPLPRIVLFPGSVLPLHIIEEPYKLMTDDLLETKQSLAMGIKADGVDIVPGTICGGGDIGLVTTYPDGRKDIFVEGRTRFKIVKCLQQKPYIRALAERIPDVPYHSEDEEKADYQKLSALVRRWIFLSPDLEDRFIDYVAFFAKSHQLADFIAFSFIPSLAEKQELLEMVERKKRVAKISDFLEGQIQKLETRSRPVVNPFGPPRTYH